ncbi:MAG: UbiA family prenyltransferase [Candidatus Micrarchaeota archaeon]|nr:UbiA family prenyltransferase [Candidatus Micrarchaeota archaeon]
MGKIAAILRLTRIEHSAMLVVAVLAAELLSGGFPAIGKLLLSIIAPIFISMASFAVNDYFDIKVDKLNMKNRPLVTGELRPDDAILIAIVCFGIGIAAAALINVYAFVIAVVFAALAYMYSYVLKEVFLMGNIYVALTMVIPFVFGNYVNTSALQANVLLISAMVFLSGLAREIHGTIRDFRGDVKVRKAKTLPRVIGMRGSATVALVLYILAIAISAFLFLYVAPFALNIVYGTIIFASDLMLLYVGLGYMYTDKQKFYEKTRSVSLIAMGMALIGIIASALVYI